MTKFPDVQLLLRETARCGVQVEALCGKLKVNAPRAVSRELVPEIRRFKPQLLVLLDDLEAASDADTPQRALLRWRARGAWFRLENVETLGERWMALASDVPRHLWGERTDAELDRDAPLIRLALEAEEEGRLRN